MTKDELFILLAFLKNVRNSEYVADQMMEDECDKLIELVERQVELNDNREKNLNATL